MNLTIRPISEADVIPIASLHAASWRSAYRGLLQDEFLDGNLPANRETLWQQRLTAPLKHQFGFIADDGADPVGFAFAFGGIDPHWGTQLDNLHVLPERKRSGIGRLLLAEIGRQAQMISPKEGVYLWVYEENVPARQFYERLGASIADRVVIDAPGGGQLAEWRYFWPSAQSLLGSLQESGKMG